MSIRIFIIDDHELVREGLKSLLARESDMSIVGEAEDAEQALAELQQADPDVVVVDQSLPGIDGVTFCREVAELRLRAEVIILSAAIDDNVAQAAFFAGARGYVVKDVDAIELRRAVRAAARRETTVDPKVAGRMLAWAARLAPTNLGTLRATEIHLLRLVARGHSNSEIASLSGLSRETVKSYLRDLYSKLEIRTRAEAAAYAHRRGLL